MSNMAQVNAVVEAARKEILALMKAKGYKQVTTKQSALYDTSFSKNGVDLYAISGWHGTGQRGTCRWYGDQKTIFALYNSQHYKNGRDLVIVKLDPKYYMGEGDQVDLTVNLEEQKKVIAEIIKYLKENA